MDKILGFLLLVVLLALLISIILCLVCYGVNIMEQHPFAGLFLVCLGIAIVPALIIGGS
jgi:hypothetical protein